MTIVPSLVFMKIDRGSLADVEELVRLRSERDNVIDPAAMRTSALIGLEDHFSFAAAVKVRSGKVLVEDDAEPRCAENDFPRPVVDGRRALVLTRPGRIPGRPQRDLVTVPEFLFV
jgi:hypothetical protein